MKKKILIPAIALMLALTSICLASCTAFTLPWEKDGQTETEEPAPTPAEETAQNNMGTMEIVSLSNSGKVFLSAGPTVVKTLSYSEDDEELISGEIPMSFSLLGATATYLEQSLVATVLPTDAPDKTVDWSVAWADDATHKSEPVSNYVTVTPSADGSATASVKCFKGFEGDIIVITVTTRVGGFAASCQVGYKGAPTSMKIDTTGKTVKTDSAWGLSMAEVKTGTTETFNIVPDNLLHAVGSSFNDYTMTIESFGGIEINQRNHSNTTGADSYTTSTMKMSASNLFDSNGYCYASIQKGGGMLIVAHFEIQDGKLVVQAQDAISSYYSMSAGRGGYSEGTFKGYIDGKCPYIKVTITEKTSGVSTTINIKTVATVNSVNLSKTSFDF